MDQLRTQSASRADEKIGIHCGQSDSPKGCLGVTDNDDMKEAVEDATEALDELKDGNPVSPAKMVAEDRTS